jgi:hypothetical protein
MSEDVSDQLPARSNPKTKKIESKPDQGIIEVARALARQMARDEYERRQQKSEG